MRPQLSVGDTLSEAFAIYGRHAGVLLPVAFWLFLVVAIFDGLVGADTSWFLPVMAVTTVAATLYKGMVVGLVATGPERLREPSIRGLVDSARPFFSQLVAAGVISGLAIAAGLILLAVPGLILLTIWAVAAPVIVVERLAVMDALRRSRELVRGYGWPVFWAVFIVLVIEALSGLVLLAFVSAGIAEGPLVRIVFAALAATITAPVSALVAAVLYYRLLELPRRSRPSAAGSDSASGSGSTPPARHDVEMSERRSLPVPVGIDEHHRPSRDIRG